MTTTTRQFLVRFVPGDWKITCILFFSVVNGEQITLTSVSLVHFEGDLPADFIARTHLIELKTKQDLIQFLNYKKSDSNISTLIEEGLSYINIDAVIEVLSDLENSLVVEEEVVDENSGDKIMVLLYD